MRSIQGLQNVLLGLGSCATVTYQGAARDRPAATNHPLSYWDININNWSIANGFYPIYVGSSSADIALRSTILVQRPPR
jgi:hypothetical protein